MFKVIRILLTSFILAIQASLVLADRIKDLTSLAVLWLVNSFDYSYKKLR